MTLGLVRQTADPVATRPIGTSDLRHAVLRVGAVVVLAALVASVPIHGAGAAGAERGPSEAILIAQIMLLIVAGRLVGEAMLYIGQPAVMGQLIAGIALGPSVLGLVWPEAQELLFPPSPEQKAMVNGLAQFGILLLLLLAGMETDVSLLRGVRRATVSASVSGIALPFTCGFLLGQWLPDALLPQGVSRLVLSLFLATALSISSVKIVAVLIREMGFARRNIGQVILASAVIDDTIGWIIIALTLGLAGHGLDWLSIAKSVLGTALFLVVSLTFGRYLVFKVIQLTNDHFRTEAPVIAAILVVMAAMALITHLIGVHTVLGAFVAGILVGQSPMLTEEIDRQLRGLVAGLFMPVFFGLAGLTADLTILKNTDLLVLTAVIIAVASIGKASGAFVGGWFGGLTRDESMALATGMNARGSTEVIVATIGLTMGVLSQSLFTMIVAMALITTLAMPPTLRWALRRLPLRPEERERLTREQFEERAFVPGLERLLVAIDASANGRFAARLAGVLAGARGIPVTVLALDADTDAGKSVQGIVKDAAEAVHIREPVAAIDVIVRAAGSDDPPEQAVAQEARRGYSLLMIGVEPCIAPDGSCHPKVSKLARAFEGSLAVVAARGEHAGNPLDSPLRILTPVVGNAQSRQGAEVAVTLAKAAQAAVAALLVISRQAGSQHHRRREARAVAEEINRIARHHAIEVAMIVRNDVSAQKAILEAAGQAGRNLVVMGVSRRPGDILSFGEVPAALLERSPCSLLFVAPQAAAKSAGKTPVAEEALASG